MPGNKGFKGIDKRDYVAPDYDSRKSGRKSTSEHSDRRYYNHDGALSPGTSTYQLKAEDWQRLGVSASYSPESGSKLFHSPDTEFGAGWSQRPVWSNCTVNVAKFKNRDEYSSVSFRIGNCLNGNSNGSWYGMGGVGPWSQMHRTLVAATVAPTAFDPEPTSWPNTYMPSISMWAKANNQLQFMVNQSAQGTVNPCNEGDLIEIRFLHGGVLQFFHNNVLFVTTVYNYQIDITQPDDKEFMFHLQSNQEGAAGNYMVYDVQMSGIVTNHTEEGGICYNRFKTQFEQTMLPISTSLWESGSYSGALPEMSTNAESGSCVNFNNGSYTTPIWTRQFVTGSGRGGIYMFQYPSASCGWGTMDEIVGITDHTLVSGYNYYTQTIAVRTSARTWGADTPGTSQYLYSWYAWNKAGTSNGGNFRTGGTNYQPVTSGSMFAFIVTGSENNVMINGGQAWDDGGATDGAQQVNLLAKLINTSGEPINDYVSGNWMNLQGTPYHKAGNGTNPMKLIFNDGNTGTGYCNIRIGDNWVASGSV